MTRSANLDEPATVRQGSLLELCNNLAAARRRLSKAQQEHDEYLEAISRLSSGNDRRQHRATNEPSAIVSPIVTSRMSVPRSSPASSIIPSGDGTRAYTKKTEQRFRVFNRMKRALELQTVIEGPVPKRAKSSLNYAQDMTTTMAKIPKKKQSSQSSRVNPTQVMVADVLAKYSAQTMGPIKDPQEKPEEKRLPRSSSSVTSEEPNTTSTHDNQDVEARESRTAHARFHQNRWDKMYLELSHYKQMYGDCLVSRGFKLNAKLGRWVDTQRSFRSKGLLSKDRIEKLDKLGFAWKVGVRHGNQWYEAYNRLARFHQRYGHCRVPRQFPDDPRLGTWVQTQRTQHKYYQEGRSYAQMNEERIRLLDAIGFEWKVNRSKKAQRFDY